MTPGGAFASLFDPRGVLVVGAGDDPERPGGRIYRYLRGGFAGDVWAVNPHRASVQGDTAYRSAIEAPQADLAVIAVPATAAAEAVLDCASAGIPWVVVLASGFADAGADGARQQQEMVTHARQAGTRVLGPNTVGLVNLGNGLAATFGTRIARLDLEVGGLAVVSQSGAVGSAILSDLAAARVPCRYFCHTGNEADVTLGEMLGAFATADEVTAIAVYAESIHDPGSLVAGLREASAQSKPVVVLSAGRSEVGARSAASHTGAMVGSQNALTAVLEHWNAVAVESPAQLTDVLRVLSAPTWPTGKRIAVVTVSGGGGVMQADAAAAHQLELPGPTPELRRRLAAAVPPYADLANPFDLTGIPIAEPTVLASTLAALAESGEYDAVSLHLVAGERAADALVNGVAKFARRANLGTAVTWQAADQQLIARLAEARVPAFDDPFRAVAAMARVILRAERGRRTSPGAAMTDHGDSPAPPEAESRPCGAAPRPSADPALLQDWLADQGIPVVTTCHLRDPAHAESAWHHVAATAPRRTAVAKLAASDLTHRSDIGAVRLGLASAAELLEAVTDLLALGRSAGVAEPVVQVQPEVRCGHEVLIGLHRDARFGWLLALGFGGVLTEIVQEIRTLVAPASEADCHDAVTSLFRGRWVTHQRGLGEDGAQAIAAIGARLSARAHCLTGWSALELNPVIVTGSAAAAVDWALS